MKEIKEFNLITDFLQQCLNRKTMWVWAPSNPHVLVQCKKYLKMPNAMSWTDLYMGRVTGPFWMEETMDRHKYNSLLN